MIHSSDQLQMAKTSHLVSSQLRRIELSGRHMHALCPAQRRSGDSYSMPCDHLRLQLIGPLQLSSAARLASVSAYVYAERHRHGHGLRYRGICTTVCIDEVGHTT